MGAIEKVSQRFGFPVTPLQHPSLTPDSVLFSSSPPRILSLVLAVHCLLHLSLLALHIHASAL